MYPDEKMDFGSGLLPKAFLRRSQQRNGISKDHSYSLPDGPKLINVSYQVPTAGHGPGSFAAGTHALSFNASVPPFMPAPAADAGLLVEHNGLGLKRKASDIFSEFNRPTKVLLTEAAEDLSGLCLNSPSSSGVSDDLAMDQDAPKTWAELHAAELMEVDQTPGRKVTPQLEMSESLKEAIRLAELADQDSLLPESIRAEIIGPPIERPCLALVPYVPPEVRLGVANGEFLGCSSSGPARDTRSDFEVEMQ